MNHSEQISELATALAKAQAAIEPAQKDALNPHLRSHYADLASVWAACRKPLSDNGLSVVQGPEPDSAGNIVLKTKLMHVSGQWVESTMPLLFDKASMQALGSAITYGRRYALSAIVGIVADHDDDGERAGEAPPQRRPEAAPSQARGQSNPERGESRPYQGNGQQRKPYDGPSKPPTSGKALFAWTREQEQKHDIGLLKFLNALMKEQGMPGRMVDLGPEDVSVCYEAAVRKIQAGASTENRGDAYEDALSN
jgi:hypothetical protein